MNFNSSLAAAYCLGAISWMSYPHLFKTKDLHLNKGDLYFVVESQIFYYVTAICYLLFAWMCWYVLEKSPKITRILCSLHFLLTSLGLVLVSNSLFSVSTPTITQFESFSVYEHFDTFESTINTAIPWPAFMLLAIAQVLLIPACLIRFFNRS